MSAARAEYEGVMQRYEAATEAWRGDTLAACERSLEAAQAQAATSAAALARTEADLGELRREATALRAALEAGLARTRLVLTLLSGLIRRGSFTARSRGRVLALLPEGAPAVGLPQVAVTALDDGAVEPQTA